MAEEDEEQRYQKEMRKRVAEAMRKQQIDQQKKEIMRQFLEPNAYERMMNIRVSNPELYDQLVGLIVNLVQTNRVTGKVSEAQLKSILEKYHTRRNRQLRLSISSVLYVEEIKEFQDDAGKQEQACQEAAASCIAEDAQEASIEPVRQGLEEEQAKA